MSHRIVSNGVCSRFSVSAPVRFAGRLTIRCDMNEKTKDAVATTLKVEGLTGERPVNEMDIAALNDLYGRIDDLRKSSDKLGVVLEELVGMFDLDGKGIAVYLLQYVAEARRTLRDVIVELEDHVGSTDSSD